MVSTDRISIIVAVCTYHRNEPLRVLLEALVATADQAHDRARVGVVVVDDDANQMARPVAEAFSDRFELGVQYRVSGHQNISLARNLAVDTAIELGDWIAMTDDDCEPVTEWLPTYLDVAERSGAHAVTGPMHLRVPAGAPAWLSSQPFFSDQLFGFADGAFTDTAATNNSFVRSSWIQDHPDIRFLPELGVLGGEDMVFYRTAHRAGLSIVYSAKAAVWGNEPPDRATFRHQVAYRYWLGNTEYVTNRTLGDASPVRLALRGANGMRRAVGRPLARLARRQAPQWRYGVASFARGLGLFVGPVGVRRRHH